MWEPHDPLSFFAHVLFGVVGYGSGLLAFASRKGSSRHVRAGWVFAAGMLVAGSSALVFMVNRFLPLALVMALATLYLVATGILAIRHRATWARTAERALVAVPIVLIALVARQLLRAPRVTVLLAGPLLLGAIFVGLALADVRLLAKRPTDPRAWRRRHLVRMTLAFGFATTAVLNINGGALGVPLQYTVLIPMSAALFVAAGFAAKERKARVRPPA